MIRFASLGSGSRGNALVVESQGTRLLLDCGFSLRELSRRLGLIGLQPNDIHALCITHEHSDHIAGAFRLALHAKLPVFMSYGCLVASAQRTPSLPDVRVIENGAAFSFGAIEIHPFSVPHDAREPLQFVFSDGAAQLCVITDLGHVTQEVRRRADRSDALLIECNHDEEMLVRGPYPAFLKKRVGGEFGHLSNASAASLLREMDGSRLRHLIAAHLSEQNNTPALARQALSEAVGCESAWIGVANQDQGLSWRDI